MKAIDATEGLTQLQEAQRIVLESTPILGLEKISILDALGRVLGEDIVAERDNPPWDNSAMDGFAVRWEDIKQEHAIQKPVTLTVIEDVAAGKMPSKSRRRRAGDSYHDRRSAPERGRHGIKGGRH